MEKLAQVISLLSLTNEGKIFEQGPPEKLFGDPQNERTEQFLHAELDAN